MFEQTVVEEVKSQQKHSIDHSENELIFTSLGSGLLLQDLITTAKLVERLSLRSLRINLIDPSYKYLISQVRRYNLESKQPSTLHLVKPSVKLEDFYFKFERDNTPNKKP